MSAAGIVYLGPRGTYAHAVALKRFGRAARLRSCESIPDVCREAAKRTPPRRGVVPIVNSSGGMIYETVDALLDPRLTLHVEEEIALNVRLALLGRKGGTIRAIYSHFVPFKHCGDWLRAEYPRVEWIEVASTAIAAREAASHPGSAAIGSKNAASIYGLDVLRFPIPGLSKNNVTRFFVVGTRRTVLPGAAKTSLAVQLPNKPGALCDFLRPLADAGLNLSRLISRPIPGRPDEFAFFVDIDENVNRPKLKNALARAKECTRVLRVIGSYPSFRVYNS